MDHERRLSGGTLDRLLREAVEAGDVPGAVAVAGIGPGGPHCVHAVGWAERWDGGARPLDASTVFDLASLTKVVATLPCLLRLAEAGQVSLDDPVVRFAAGFAGPGKDAVTIRHLLAHTAGLPDHRPYWSRRPRHPRSWLPPWPSRSSPPPERRSATRTSGTWWRGTWS